MNGLVERYIELRNSLGEIYRRQFYDEFRFSHRIVGIVGNRGVGKTTFMLHYLKENYADSEKVLYVSADNIYFSQNTLFDLVDQFRKEYGGELICIDEIHKYRNWAQELKNIYDSYPDFKVLFSGSSSIDLVKEKYDLSRRAALKRMEGFSFREYLEFRLKMDFPKLTLDEIVANRKSPNQKIAGTERLLGLFKEYLRTGYYPIFTEFEMIHDFYDSLLGIVDKNVYVDIASFYSLKTSTLEVFKKILYLVATSKPFSVNVNRIARSLGKDYNTVSDYLNMLRDSGLLRYLLIDKTGHALIRNAEKIYLNNTNLAYAIAYGIEKMVDQGVIRELFVLSQLQNAGEGVLYSKIGDFKCGKYIFEVGGKNKDLKQLKDAANSFLVKDDVLVGDSRSIPLYLFGFLY